MEEIRRYDRLKRCPFCAEEILVAAIRCKHCQADLASAPPQGAPATPVNPLKRPLKAPETIAGILGAALVMAWLAGAFDSSKAVGPPPAASEVNIPQAAESAQIPTSQPMPESPATQQTDSAPPKQKKVRGTYQTTAADLYRDYNANEVATDQKIDGAMVEISGIIKSIDKDAFGDPEIRLEVSDEFGSVGLTLDKSQLPAAGRLSKGQSITARCDRFERIVDFPVGTDCQLSN